MLSFIKGNVTLSYFIILALLGVLIFKDYGFSFDELIQRQMGLENLKYVANVFSIDALKNSDLFHGLHIEIEDEVSTKFYGVAYELIWASFEYLVGITDSRKIYLIRHLSVFLIFYASLIAFYKIVIIRYGSKTAALLAVTLLILSPRIFSDSFYNTKDLVFLSLFTISIYTLIRFSRAPTIGNAIFHGVISAFAIDTRLMAMVVPVFTLMVLVAGARHKKLDARIWSKYLLYLFVTSIVSYAFWPWIWDDPIRKILFSIASTAKFPYGEILYVLYFGNKYSALQVPWHYVLTWILITTPLLYLSLYFIGAITVVLQLIQSFKDRSVKIEYVYDLVFLTLTIAPIAAVILLKSVIYDGWRHLYFIYPFILLIAIRGAFYLFDILSRHRKIYFFTVMLGVLYLFSIGVWMIRSHPMQNVFFNFLAPNDVYKKFDVDYWGLSTRIGLEKILHSDSRRIIKIHSGSFLNLEHSLFILKPQDRSRFLIVNSLHDADYVLTNYRLNDRDYGAFEGFSLFTEVAVAKQKVLSIFKNNERAAFDWPYLSLGQDYYLNKNSSYILNVLNDVGVSYWMGKGWAYPENWGVWSDGIEASIILPVPNEKISSVTMLIKPYINSARLKQNITIQVDSQKPIDYIFSSSSPEKIKINLDYKSQTKNFITIKFFIKEPLSPKDLGLNDDLRKLGIGLIAVKFD